MTQNQEPVLNWAATLKQLESVTSEYRSLIGTPGVNPFFAIGVIAAAQKRFDDGEKTQELYDEIWAIE